MASAQSDHEADKGYVDVDWFEYIRQEDEV